MDKIMSLPRTKEFLDWKPEGFTKSVEELRKEIGPELSDDDLLLKILIPGKPPKRSEPRKQVSVPQVTKTTAPAAPLQSIADFPREFSVDVDGEVFNVKISPVWNETEVAAKSEKPRAPQAAKELPRGAVVCGMAGLILSIEVKVGGRVAEGDLVAMIEAMKMRRHILSPRSGVVKEIRAKEGEIVDSEDVLMIVE
jgi:biotin carboxyl carrier protein